jgi:hypothetical protein
VVHIVLTVCGCLGAGGLVQIGYVYRADAGMKVCMLFLLFQCSAVCELNFTSAMCPLRLSLQLWSLRTEVSVDKPEVLSVGPG